jgi:hypothetical protein
MIADERRVDVQAATGPGGSATPSAPVTGGDTALNAVDAFVRQLYLFRSNATCLASAEIDRIKVKARSTVILLMLVLVATTLVCAVVVVSVTLVGVGAAWALTELFGGRQWLGFFAAGGLMLISIASMGLVMWRLLEAYSLRKARQRYQTLRPGSETEAMSKARSESEYLQLQSAAARQDLKHQVADATDQMAQYPLVIGLLAAGGVILATQATSRDATASDGEVQADSSASGTWTPVIAGVMNLLQVVSK